MARRLDSVLRIGVVRGSKVIEERLFRRPETITIGQSPRCTLYHPSPALPAKTVLFDHHGGQFHLRLGHGLTGRLSQDGTVQNLALLAKGDLVSRHGGKSVALAQGTRGKLQLGDVTVLFQQVAAPVPRPKVVLPVSVRGGLTTTLGRETPVLLAIGLSILFHGGGLVASKLLEAPPDIVDKRKPIMTAMRYEVSFNAEIPEQPDEPETVVTDADAKDPEVEEALTETDATPTPRPQPTPTLPAVEEKRPTRKQIAKAPSRDTHERVKKRPTRRKQWRQKTILHTLTSPDESLRAGGPDTLRNGKAMVDAAFGKKGVQVAQSTKDVGGFQGGPKMEQEPTRLPERLRRDDRASTRLRTKRVVRKADKRKETAITPRLRTLRPRGPKDAPLSITVGVRRFFRKRNSALRACYERRLKVRPDLEGKVVIRLTLTATGKVGHVGISQNTTGDSKVAECIRKKVGGWSINAAASGATMRFSLPIMLSRKR